MPEKEVITVAHCVSKDVIYLTQDICLSYLHRILRDFLFRTTASRFYSLTFN